MLSSRYYLISAMYEWILDSSKTPHISVDTSIDYVDVPTDFISNNEIILDLSPAMLNAFSISKSAIQFKARFNGRLRLVYVPLKAVKALYSYEEGLGVGFTTDGVPYFAGDCSGDQALIDEDTQALESDPNKPSSATITHLSVVKNKNNNVDSNNDQDPTS